MTELAVASTDATNIEARIERRGDEYVLNARKGWATSAVDWALHAHGAGGVCDDFPLAAFYAEARSLRLADGPDEVHREHIGRLELARYAAR